MKIDKSTFPSLAIEDEYVRVFNEYARDILHQARLFPKLSKPRLIEAYGAWQNDLKRIEEHEPNLVEGLDHFKQCGHMAFWLRRMSPLVEASDNMKNIGDSTGYGITEEEEEFRNLLFGYGNEYLAFDFGFQFCKFYELRKEEAPSSRTPSLDIEYLKTICHFLKYKTVSPHALFLTYKSLFIL